MTQDGADACAAHRIALLQYGAPLLLCLVLLAKMPHMAGADLWPPPDAVEYALLADQLAHGHAPLLEIGPHLYPSRYALTYPLTLVPWVWLLRGDLALLYLAPLVYAVLATLMLVRVGRWITGSGWAAMLAGLLWCTHPAMLRGSAMVMSEPALLLGFALMLELGRPWLLRKPLPRPVTRAGALALCVAWLTLSKAPYSYWALAFAVLMLMRLRHPLKEDSRPALLRGLVAYVAIGLALAGAELAYRAWAFGSPTGDGYVYWVPDVYGRFLTTFNARYVTVPHDAWATEGNLRWYAKLALGWVPQFHTRAHAVVMLAGFLGAAAMLLRARFRDARSVVWVLLGGWATLGGVFCLFYFFQSERFPLIVWPVADWLIAGAVVGGARVIALRMPRAGLAIGLIAAAALLALQVPLVQAVWRERATGVEVSRLPAARRLLEEVPPGAWVATNYELALVQHLRGDARVAALHAHVDGDGWFNGHMARLSMHAAAPHGRAPGSQAELPAPWQQGPPLLLDGQGAWSLDAATQQRMLGSPLWALVLAPAHYQPARDALEALTFPRLRERYTITPVRQSGDLALYRLDTRQDAAAPNR